MKAATSTGSIVRAYQNVPTTEDLIRLPVDHVALVMPTGEAERILRVLALRMTVWNGGFTSYAPAEHETDVSMALLALRRLLLIES